MNLAGWLKESRLKLGTSCVAVFGVTANGPTWGTGTLLDFRGVPLVLTCAHVVDPIVGTVYVTTGRVTVQAAPLYHNLIKDSGHDWAALVLRDRAEFGAKRFVCASHAVLQPMGKEESVLVYGFPIGRKLVQVGGQIDLANSTASFRSMTYLTVTGSFTMRNSRLNNREQPLLEWNSYGNRDAKTFQPLPADLSPQQRGGFSGGPVFLPDARRLVGQVTDASLAWLWYNPIAAVLSAIDRAL